MKDAARQSETHQSHANHMHLLNAGLDCTRPD